MYIPFLKAKKNEILALRNCSARSYQNIIPFFDIPRPSSINESDIVESITKSKGYIDKLLSERDILFYIDTFDIPPNSAIANGHPYDYLLNLFTGIDLIPVIGLDREDEHIQAVVSRQSDFDIIAIRLLEEDLRIPSSTLSNINDLISEFEPDTTFDFIFDLRLIRNTLPTNTSQNITRLIHVIKNTVNVENFVITGSIIPPLITEICPPNNSNHLEKAELNIFREVLTLIDPSYIELLIYGDYTSVSPDYSDSNIAPELMRTVQTPKIIYSEDNNLYITRGGALQRQGDQQYFDLALDVVNCGLWRGRQFSSADKYIDDISRRTTIKCGNASKWINICVCAHIESYAHLY